MQNTLLHYNQDIHFTVYSLLKVLVATTDAQWEGMGGCRVGEVWADTTSPIPDHKGFMLLVIFQKFSTFRVKEEWPLKIDKSYNSHVFWNHMW